jgi:hypothetical protein
VARRLIVPLTILAALAPAAGAEGKQLTRYVVGGGIAGRVDQLVVQNSGAAHQSGDGGDHRWKVSAKKLRALKRAFKAARWSSLKREYRPDVPVFDGITQSVSYRGKQVTISTGAEVPTRLERVIVRIRRIMKS